MASVEPPTEKTQEHGHRLTPARVGATVGVVSAAAGVAAAAWYEYEHRRATQALLADKSVKIVRLTDLKLDQESLDMIEAGLRAEWGPFALVGFSSMKEMANEAGATTFIALHRGEDGRYLPKGALQTTLADVHGDPALLREAYPSFEALTSKEAWRRARGHGGDTVILLQIAVFEHNERGAGLGSLLRNAVFYMLGDDVKYALTATPVDPKPGAPSPDVADPSTYTPAMKFHQRGGAQATVVLPDYKARPADAGDEAPHGTDVSVMRYARDAEGKWTAPRPEMRLRLLGPLEERLFVGFRRLRIISLRGRRVLRSMRNRVQGTAIRRRLRARREALRAVEELFGDVTAIADHDDGPTDGAENKQTSVVEAIEKHQTA